MSDVPSPPDAGDEDKGRPQRLGLRLSDAGIVAAARLDSLGDEPSTQPPAAAPPATSDGQALDGTPQHGAAGGHEADGAAHPAAARGHGPDSALPDAAGDRQEPDGAPHPGASDGQAWDGAPPITAEGREEGPLVPPASDRADDHQPMLDLGLPDAPPASDPAAPQRAADAAAGPRAEPAPFPFSLAQFAPLHVPHPTPPFPTPPQWDEPSEPPAAATPAEISPILSALDAAEMRTRAAHARPEPTGGEPFGARILLPRFSEPGEGLPEPPAEADADQQQHADDDPLAAAAPPAQATSAEPPPPPVRAEPGHDRFRPPTGELPRATRPALDAAAKIAAEATATAEALESLKRLLQHKLPNLNLVTPPRQFEHAHERAAAPPPRQYEHARERAAAPPPAPPQSIRITAGLPPIILSGPSAPRLPMSLASEPISGTTVYARGFLAGLGLALMTGIMLYLFISIG